MLNEVVESFSKEAFGGLNKSEKVVLRNVLSGVVDAYRGTVDGAWAILDKDLYMDKQVHLIEEAYRFFKTFVEKYGSEQLIHTKRRIEKRVSVVNIDEEDAEKFREYLVRAVKLSCDVAVEELIESMRNKKVRESGYVLTTDIDVSNPVWGVFNREDYYADKWETPYILALEIRVLEESYKFLSSFVERYGYLRTEEIYNDLWSGDFGLSNCVDEAKPLEVIFSGIDLDYAFKFIDTCRFATSNSVEKILRSLS